MNKTDELALLLEKFGTERHVQAAQQILSRPEQSEEQFLGAQAVLLLKELL